MHPKTIVPPLLLATLLTVAGPRPDFALAASRAVPARSDAAAGPEVVTPSGVRYVDLRVGSGDEAQTGKIVEVQYVGWLQDGTRFDSSRDRDRPFTFRLGAGDALKGWDEGLAGMKVGGKRKLIIPPDLGFGKQGVGSVVPPGSILFYEFELLGVR
ncbi:MAG TPA: FKBP-type peptidyl-prolyl cis-trans isomerase [Thermoanaerobaculia bacterium]|jgi:peptidylprolyl isomerase|nr:FKBP-type peptidyl-prolyl cis-trans isomerase [Thermoanaerobaculia bacterium]